MTTINRRAAAVAAEEAALAEEAAAVESHHHRRRCGKLTVDSTNFLCVASVSREREIGYMS